MTAPVTHLPFKSVAGALLFTVLLGPIGLLYASFWGGFIMILIGIIVFCNKFFFPILLTWLICCIWAVRAVEKHNKTVVAAACANR